MYYAINKESNIHICSPNNQLTENSSAMRLPVEGTGYRGSGTGCRMKAEVVEVGRAPLERRRAVTREKLGIH